MARRLFTPRIILAGLVLGLAALMIVVPLAAQDAGGDSTTVVPSSYVIQRGDVLDVLAQQWNISLDALMQANDFTFNTIIYTGDTIIVPRNAPPYGSFPPLEDTTQGAGGGAVIPGESYVIQPNDVLDTIGQEFNVSVEALIDANNITNTRRIFAGQTIIIPDDAPAYGEPLPRTSAVTNTTAIDTTAGAGGGISGDVYVVKRNDTLDGIAADYNVETKCLAASNNLKDPAKIFVGQEIVIDTTCPAYDGVDVVGGALQ